MFAPTVAVSSVRLLAALVFELHLDLCHFDIELDFVQSDLEEDVHMWLPQLWKIIGEDSQTEQEPVRLETGIKSMACAPCKNFIDFGFVKCNADACVFRLMERGA